MIEFVVDRLINLLGNLREFGRDRRELRDNALRAISHALNETYLYYRDIDNGKERDLDIEAQLSRYWSAAATPLRHIDANLAEICENKSEYWINPQSYDQSKIKQLGIGLKDVRERYRQLLYPQFASRNQNLRQRQSERFRSY